MNQSDYPGHIELEELADYCEGLLSDRREGEIDEHLAECTDCMTLAREFTAFSDVWDSWTAKSHGAAYAQATRASMRQSSPLASSFSTLAAVLGEITVRQQDLREDLRKRLTAWRDRMSAQVSAAVRLTQREMSKALQTVTEQLDTLVPSPQPVRVRGGGNTRGTRSVLAEVWKFAFEPPLVPLGGALVTRGARSPSGTVTIPTTPLTQLTVEKDVPEVEIRIELWPADQPLPLVLLTPLTDPTQSQLAEAQRQPSETYLVVRFTNITAGDYTIAFEPLSETR